MNSSELLNTLQHYYMIHVRTARVGRACQKTRNVSRNSDDHQGQTT